MPVASFEQKPQKRNFKIEQQGSVDVASGVLLRTNAVLYDERQFQDMYDEIINDKVDRKRYPIAYDLSIELKTTNAKIQIDNNKILLRAGSSSKNTHPGTSADTIISFTGIAVRGMLQPTIMNAWIEPSRNELRVYIGWVQPLGVGVEQ